MIKKNTENEEDDYIIDNDQEIEDFEDNNNYNNNNKKSKISVPKEQNKNNKSPKMSYRSGGEWVKEAKEKYKQEKNRNNIAKTESRISDNKKNNKKIMNFDDMPVGGGGMRREADFNIEIKVPAKKNKFIEKNNNNINDNYAENFVYNKKLKSKDKFGDDLDRRKSNNKDLGNDYYEDNNNNNEQAEMERKNSLVSMVTQTCDREMVGRSEFIEIPVDQHNLAHNINNNTEINFDSNIARLADNKQPFSILEKNDNNFISKKNTDFEMSNFSNINRLTDYSTTQNFREKTENAIQMQNIQRELDNEIEMNKRLQGQIENYKNEFNNLREELVKKSDIINELQQKISKLEKDLFLQGNQLIEAESKPSQEHYEDIVNNYEEMKKNFDKAVERIKMLSDENAELKEKNMRLEESIKKLKREKVSNINKSKNVNKKSFNTYQNEYENENENDFYNQNEGIINEENEHYRDIQDNKKSDEISKRLNNDHYFRHDTRKPKSGKNSKVPNIDSVIENQEFLIFANSNEKGQCKIVQCSYNILYFLGYEKKELIRKPIEILMPTIFIEGHKKMLEERIKRMISNQSSLLDSARNTNQKQNFILLRNKVGYLLPMNSKFTIYDDSDYSNTYIIKGKMEPTDSKSVYAYYILTKPDFTIDSISSSALNLGLSMDLLKKYLVKMSILIRTKEDEPINLFETYMEFEDEPRQVIWVYPHIIYPKDNSQRIQENNLQDLIAQSPKGKFYLQINI